MVHTAETIVISHGLGQFREVGSLLRLGKNHSVARGGLSTQITLL